MAQAKYSFEHFTANRQHYIAIEDKGRGNSLSLTQDIKNVVAEIAESKWLAPAECLIVYKNCMGEWNGYDGKNDKLIVLGACSEAQAFLRLKKIMYASRVAIPAKTSRLFIEVINGNACIVQRSQPHQI